MRMITMYAIRNVADDLWFNVELDGWVEDYELEGDCLFPTEEMAQNFIDTEIREDLAKVFKVKVSTTDNYEYSPIE